MDSQSDFSQASPDSPPPAFFPLYLQYAEEFTDSKLYPDIDASSEVPDKLTFMRFEDEENEKSYNKFRNGERKIFLMDYAEEYCSTTEHGELVIKQRFLMVNWIIEQSKLRELQNETMFLAISLLDRFLTQGFFKNKRNLEVLGIACLTLAIRIEENQPLNWDIKRSSFSEKETFKTVLSTEMKNYACSTLLLESAFSTGKRVLDPFRTSLSPTTVEALICAQDWLRPSMAPVDLRAVMDGVEEFEKIDDELLGNLSIHPSFIEDCDV